MKMTLQYSFSFENSFINILLYYIHTSHWAIHRIRIFSISGVHHRVPVMPKNKNFIKVLQNWNLLVNVLSCPDFHLKWKILRKIIVAQELWKIRIKCWISKRTEKWSISHFGTYRAQSSNLIMEQKIILFPFDLRHMHLHIFSRWFRKWSFLIFNIFQLLVTPKKLKM